MDDYIDDVDSVASTSRDFYPGLPNPSHSTNKTPCRTIASQQITLSTSKDANNIEIVPADYDVDEKDDMVYTPPVPAKNYNVYATPVKRKSKTLSQLQRKTIEQIERGSFAQLQRTHEHSEGMTNHAASHQTISPHISHLSGTQSHPNQNDNITPITPESPYTPPQNQQNGNTNNTNTNQHKLQKDAKDKQKNHVKFLTDEPNGNYQYNYRVSVSGPSGDDITPNPTSQSIHNKEQQSPEDLQSTSPALDLKNANVTKNIKLKIDTQNVQSPKKKSNGNIKFDGNSPKSTDVNPRQSDNESTDVPNNNNNNNNDKAKESKTILPVKDKNNTNTPNDTLAANGTTKTATDNKTGKTVTNGNNTLNPNGNFESPSIVSMNSNTSNTSNGTPNSAVSNGSNREISEIDGNSDADLLTPDSCMSETSYLMNLFHPNNRLDNSRFDRPEVKALKEKAAAKNSIGSNNDIDNATRKRKKSNSALAYFEDQNGRKYSNPLARPKINRNNMVAGATGMQRLSNASSGTNTSSSNTSNGRSRHNSGVITPYTPLSIAASVDSLENIPNSNSELGNYDQHKKLGNGTDAYVYEMIDRRNLEHVAMKLTKRKSGRYRTEIHLLHNLRACPYVVTLLKCLENDKIYVLVLEHAPMCLEKLLLKKCCETPMSEVNARDILRNVLKGLYAIHNLGFVHKDIKPENVLIFANREKKTLQAKIADFGFATRAAPKFRGFTNKQDKDNNKDVKTGINQASSDAKRFENIPLEKQEEFRLHVADKCGTPGFWAPELVAGTVKLSEAFKLDVFSAGVTLYRMLCNEMPFGLFEQWRVNVSKTGEIKLAKMKPNFKVISWKKEISYDSKNEVQTLYTPSLFKEQLSDECIEFLRGMLRVRPGQRFNLEDCLNHHFMKSTGNMSKFDVSGAVSVGVDEDEKSRAASPNVDTKDKDKNKNETNVKKSRKLTSDVEMEKEMKREVERQKRKESQHLQAQHHNNNNHNTQQNQNNTQQQQNNKQQGQRDNSNSIASNDNGKNPRKRSNVLVIDRKKSTGNKSDHGRHSGAHQQQQQHQGHRQQQVQQSHQQHQQPVQYNGYEFIPPPNHQNGHITGHNNGRGGHTQHNGHMAHNGHHQHVHYDHYAQNVQNMQNMQYQQRNLTHA